jgi:hypothetical protein
MNLTPMTKDQVFKQLRKLLVDLQKKTLYVKIKAEEDLY